MCRINIKIPVEFFLLICDTCFDIFGAYEIAHEFIANQSTANMQINCLDTKWKQMIYGVK